MIRATVLFGFLVFAAAHAAAPEIVATKGVLRYSSQAGTSSMQIKAKSGGVVYVLSLVRTKPAEERRVQFELVLHRPGDKTGAPNLLDPTVRWLDTEEYEIAASDFSRGLTHAYTGLHIMWLEPLQLEHRFSVIGAKVHPVDKDGRTFEFDDLTLSVEIRPWKPMPGKPCDGVDRRLTEQRKAAFRDKMARELKLPNLQILQSFTFGDWNIVYVDTTVSDETFFFYPRGPLKAKQIAAWSGAATVFEEEEMFDWTLKNAAGIPPQLARCFAYLVTNGRDQ